jgi:glycosyltransferase involved in cell wall biosynthesis
MANSVPVVATHVGEIPSVIEDGVSGLLVSPGDVDALKGGMLFFLESPKAGKEMARVGLEVVRTRYSAENMTGKTEAIYRSLLDN